MLPTVLTICLNNSVDCENGIYLYWKYFHFTMFKFGCSMWKRENQQQRSSVRYYLNRRNSMRCNIYLHTKLSKHLTWRWNKCLQVSSWIVWTLHCSIVWSLPYLPLNVIEWKNENKETIAGILMGVGLFCWRCLSLFSIFLIDFCLYIYNSISISIFYTHSFSFARICICLTFILHI